MGRYDSISISECIALNECVGVTFNINDGQVVSVNFNEEGEDNGKTLPCMRVLYV